MDQSPKAADASARPQRPSVHTGSFLGVQDPAVRAHPGGGLSPSSGLDLRLPSRVSPTGFLGGPHVGPPVGILHHAQHPETSPDTGPQPHGRAPHHGHGHGAHHHPSEPGVPSASHHGHGHGAPHHPGEAGAPPHHGHGHGAPHHPGEPGAPPHHGHGHGAPHHPGEPGAPPHHGHGHGAPHHPGEPGAPPHHGHGAPHHPGEPGAPPHHGRPHQGAPRHHGTPHHRAEEHPPDGEPQAKEEAGREGFHAKLPSRERPAISQAAISQAAISQAFLPRAHPSMTPSAMRFRDSLHSAGPSRVTILSRSSRSSSKVHPQFTTKESETWQDEEKIHKRKLGRIPRIHKKIYGGSLVQQILDKICAILGTLRIMIRSLTYSLAFETIIFLFVCLNTIMLVAQTFAELEIRGEWYFLVFDSIFLCIYVLEALLKIIALGLEYFIDPWNNLDFFIMIMAVLEFVFIQINSLTYSFYNHSIFRILKVFKSLRALRALRVLRRLSILTSLHEVTGTLARTLPSITAILILMFTCLFLFSVVLRALFRHSDPKRFQSILTTIFTLFTLLTLDDWSLIYLDSRAQGAWYIIPILMIYIIIQYFIFLNLVIAVLVDNFQMALLRNLEKVKQEKAAQIHEKLLDDSLTELKQAENEEIKNSIALGKEFIERKFGTMTEKPSMEGVAQGAPCPASARTCLSALTMFVSRK
ncbi:cation channel sperm-associated protein 1-like isoform X2 [Dipodomys merriami]|uniref:cation channel sperm-associated protein 1-like isoform X2 n=1 Tax=Dipodomys merriami TaxID=94247 RepID=UPI0038505B4F